MFYLGPGIDPKDIPFGEILAAFPFEGKIFVVTKYSIYVNDPKDRPEKFTRLPVDINRE